MLAPFRPLQEAQQMPKTRPPPTHSPELPARWPKSCERDAIRKAWLVRLNQRRIRCVPGSLWLIHSRASGRRRPNPDHARTRRADPVASREQATAVGVRHFLSSSGLSRSIPSSEDDRGRRASASSSSRTRTGPPSRSQQWRACSALEAGLHAWRQCLPSPHSVANARARRMKRRACMDSFGQTEGSMGASALRH